MHNCKKRQKTYFHINEKTGYMIMEGLGVFI